VITRQDGDEETLAETYHGGNPRDNTPSVYSHDLQSHDLKPRSCFADTCYGADVIIYDDEVVSFDGQAVHTWRALLTCTATIMEEGALWKETIINTSLGVLTYITSYNMVHGELMGFSILSGSVKTSGMNLGLQLQLISEFSSSLRLIVGFLLGLYLNLVLSRWWSLRMGGVGRTQDAIMALQMHLCGMGETNAAYRISRYGRASLLMFWFRAEELQNRKILTPQEMKTLGELNLDDARDEEVNISQLMWVWISGYMTDLMQTGRIKVPPHYMFAIIKDGMEGVGLVAHYMGTKLPLQYVHIITLFVKVQNMFIALLGGIIVFVKFDEGKSLSAQLEIVKILLVPWLFNAALLICGKIDDPFGNDLVDFPGKMLDRDLRLRSRAFQKAGRAWEENPPTGDHGKFVKPYSMEDLEVIRIEDANRIKEPSPEDMPTSI